jgi:hypothetical protein
MGAATTKGGNAHAEPFVLRKQIGSTMFRVNVCFSRTGNETMEDKILRMVEREVSNDA